MQYKTEYARELESIIHKLSKNKNLLHEFLFDLLTPAEYKDLAVRFQIVKQLSNNIPHRDIAKHLKVSVATISRGSRELMNKKGGFRLILNKYYKKQLPK